MISPGPAFVADGVQLAGPLAAQLPQRANDSRRTPRSGSADHREVDVAASAAPRVLVVPESVNPGWTAHSADGTALSAGHGQRLAAGLGRARRHVGPHRARLRVEHALPRRPVRRPGAAARPAAARPPSAAAAGRRPTCAARPWRPGRRRSAPRVLAVGFVCLRRRRRRRRRRSRSGCATCCATRPRLSDRVTLGATAAG